MAEPRIWADPREGVIEGEAWHHLVDVLRVRTGSYVRVCCGDGFEYRLRVVLADRREGRVEVVDKTALPPEPRTRITLMVALLKGDHMDAVVQAVTELGVAAIVPMETGRAIARAERTPRWRKIAQMATAQSRRSTCPRIEPVVSFTQALAQTRGQTGLLFWEGSEPSPTLHRLLISAPAAVAVLVGPEGGFTDAEVAEAAAAGLHVCSLGPRTLRAQTAAVIAPALVLQTLGELA